MTGAAVVGDAVVGDGVRVDLVNLLVKLRIRVPAVATVCALAVTTALDGLHGTLATATAQYEEASHALYLVGAGFRVVHMQTSPAKSVTALALCAIPHTVL